MPPGRLILSALFLAGHLFAADPSLPRNGELGKRWAAKAWTPKFNLLGYWVRRGASNEFDADYTDAKTRQQFFWRIAVLSVNGADVRMKATLALDGGQKTYDIPGKLLGDGRTIRARPSWCGASTAYCGLEVTADWPVAERVYKQFAKPGSSASPTPPPGAVAAATLKTVPARLRVKDNAIPGFPYSGTWTIQGNEVRFSYLDPSGKNKAEGFMVLEKWDGSYLFIRNRGARRLYQGAVQSGGKSISGTVTPCPPKVACTWEAVIEK